MHKHHGQNMTNPSISLVQNNVIPSSHWSIILTTKNFSHAREPGHVHSLLWGMDTDGLLRPNATNLVVVIWQMFPWLTSYPPALPCIELHP